MKELPSGVIAIEDRIRNTSPNCDGLYPHEILLLSYAEWYKTKRRTFPKFWLYEYGITDVQKELKKLVQKKLIEYGTLHEEIYSCTADEIRKVLALYSLKKSGTKAVLQERLLKSIPEEELELFFPERHYHLTEEGKN